MKFAKITATLLASIGLVKASQFELTPSEDGIIDAKMRRVTKDGRDADQVSFFEYVRQRHDEGNSEGRKALQATHGVNVDVNMNMMWDLNHAIELKVKSSDKGLHLIPTTRMADMVVMHESCDSCWSMHNAKWTADWPEPVGGENVAFTPYTFEYIHMLHIYKAETEGHWWRMNACLNTTQEACATDLFFYAVHKAKPRFNSLGDGYFGLSPSKGIAGSPSMNALDQIYDRGMISKKMFGVHTHLYNSTESPSEIRFGGYNEELFKEGHKQVWFNTTSTMSWEVKFNDASFHTERLWNNTHALIDPGYPFIGMPFHEF